MSTDAPDTATIRMPPKQHQFVTCHPGRAVGMVGEILASGAKGSSKSLSLAFSALDHLKHPNNRVGLFRRSLSDLEGTTLDVLLNGVGTGPDRVPALLGPGCIASHDKKHRIIKVRLGEGRTSTLIYGGFDTYSGGSGVARPERLGSLNLGCALIDEATEATQPEWDAILVQCRNQADPNPEIRGACNPAHPGHWLYNRFVNPPAELREGLSVEEYLASVGRAIIYSTPDDNPFLPMSIRRTLESMKYNDPQGYRRYVLGLWESYEGLIYTLTEELHRVTRADAQWERIVAGVDEGFEHPACIVVFGVDSDKRMHMIDAFHESHYTHARIAGQAQKMSEAARTRYGGEGIERFYCSPDAPGLISELRGLDLSATNRSDAQTGINGVMAGISLVRDLLVVQEDGRPRMTFEPGVGQRIWDEMVSYHYKGQVVTNPGGHTTLSTAKEEPAKTKDDGPDAVRYCAAGLHGISKSSVSISGEYAGKKSYDTEAERELAQAKHLDEHGWGTMDED